MLIEQAFFRNRTYLVKCLVLCVFALVNNVQCADSNKTSQHDFFKKAKWRDDGLVCKHNLLPCVRASLHREEVLNNTQIQAMVLVSAAEIWAAESGNTLHRSFVCCLLGVDYLPSQHPYFNFAQSSSQAQRVNNLHGTGMEGQPFVRCTISKYR